MSASLHPAASHHLPAFITAPGETDVLMVVMSVILLIAVLAFGILFFRLHSLPERIAHRGHKLQFEIVAVLCLIALFTHIHLFWVAALLLAMIDIPDFGSSLGRIAGSVEKMAGVKPGDGAADVPGDLFSPGQGDGTADVSRKGASDIRDGEGAGEVPRENVAAIKRGDGTTATPARPELVPTGTRS